YLPLGMVEAGQLLPVSLTPLAPDLAATLPGWSADPHVITFCQSLVVLVGVVGSWVLQRRLRQADRWRWLLGPLLVLGLGAGGRWLVALP
ncbi:4Fe-4S binding protein, partial [Synechococcus sp. CCY9201]|nr:4Fe-4S binding protein [Synechococcus sp. CCY9201]